MKKLFLVSLLIVSSGIAQADTSRLVSADGSELSAICIAAVESRAAMHARIAELGMRDLEPNELRCNGQTLARFVSTHRAATAAEAAARYMFSMSDESPETALCVAAVRSEQEFAELKARHFEGEENIEAEVRCNGIPLQTFARRYRAPAQTLSLR